MRPSREDVRSVALAICTSQSRFRLPARFLVRPPEVLVDSEPVSRFAVGVPEANSCTGFRPSERTGWSCCPPSCCAGGRARPKRSSARPAADARRLVARVQAVALAPVRGEIPVLVARRNASSRVLTRHRKRAIRWAWDLRGPRNLSLKDWMYCSASWRFENRPFSLRRSRCASRSGPEGGSPTND
jgi:hypothetical protein